MFQNYFVLKQVMGWNNFCRSIVFSSVYSYIKISDTPDKCGRIQLYAEYSDCMQYKKDEKFVKTQIKIRENKISNSNINFTKNIWSNKGTVPEGMYARFFGKLVDNTSCFVFDHFQARDMRKHCKIWLYLRKKMFVTLQQFSIS